MCNEVYTQADRRLANIEGHIRAIRKMLADERACEEIMVQMRAVENAVHNVGTLILKHHLNHCVKEGVKNGDGDILDRFNKVLESYL